MNHETIFSHVDHTLLAANAAAEDILKLCQEAVRYNMASVCIPPSYISLARTNHPNLNLCTVIGFPLGYSSTNAKVQEIKDALKDGCNEFDMVINISWAKNGEFDKITEEIAALKDAVGDKVLKVIIETCYLNEEEKLALCKCVTDAKADYIKTSTGFGTAGAVLEDIALFKSAIGPAVKIKAAGGVRTKEDMIAFLRAGCDRIGTSGAIKALSGETIEGY
ncbi:MAG: deoxyribose-phosphate aldolase [Lacrimispora sp.]|uniref:deoxyribose-phosphate aldolase n=1 Tax=Lacrimispora sp. TaxID=2719234 RepID=UPI0039E6D882